MPALSTDTPTDDAARTPAALTSVAAFTSRSRRKCDDNAVLRYDFVRLCVHGLPHDDNYNVIHSYYKRVHGRFLPDLPTQVHDNKLDNVSRPAHNIYTRVA